MAFTYNPLLSEINGLSDAAKGALGMAGHTLPSADPGTAPQLPPGMLLPHPDAGPPAGNISMPDSPSLIGMPKPAPQLVMGPKSRQEMLSNGQQLHPGTLLGDKAELERQAGKKPALESVYSGITGSKFGEAHPFLGKLLGGLAQIPATALDVAASLPYGGSIARLTPGTTLNNRLQTSTLENRIAGEENNAGKEATTAATEAEVPLREAETQKAGAEAEIAPQEGQERIALQDAQIQNLLHPQARTEFEAWRQQNPGAPVENWLKAQQSAKPEKELTAEADLKNQIAAEEAKPNGGDPKVVSGLKKRLQDLNPQAEQRMAFTINQAGEKASKATDANTEKEYTYQRNKWDKDLGTFNTQAENLSKAYSLIGKGAMGDALGEVKALSGVAGGQGSGVRITQAELNNVIHARGYQGEFDTWLQKFGSGKNLSDVQEKELDGVLDGIRGVVKAKEAVINQGLDDLSNATDTKTIRKIDSQLRHVLMGAQ